MASWDVSQPLPGRRKSGHDAVMPFGNEFVMVLLLVATCKLVPSSVDFVPA